MKNILSTVLIVLKDVCGESELRKMDEQEMYAVYDKCILTNYPAVECYKVEI